MEWVRENSAFILFFILFIAMHMFGHGMHRGHGGCGGHGEEEVHKGHGGEGTSEKTDTKGGHG